ncbi:hypothetical protein MMC29_003372 [Sticta canariensis]|nr:hypothetical protein [Sticta canariensis]
MATLRPPSALRPGRGGRRSRSFGIVKIPENQPPPPDPFLLRWNELHSWQKDNQYILAHYRPVSNSYFRSFQSLFYLHNESVNIHSHLLGAFVFLFISFTVYAFEVHRVSISDVYAFGCFFAGAIMCLGISAFYHTISNHSPAINRLGNQLDYLGIIALITGSFVPSAYYGFYCDPLLQKVYWGMILSIGSGCTMMSVTPKFRTPKWRPFRAAMFVAMGLSAVFPVLHGLLLYGMQDMNKQIGLSWVVLQGFLYVLGAAIYAARVPERLHPGTFDVWGSSHQIFHVLIILAAMAHLVGLLKSFDHAQRFSTC